MRVGVVSALTIQEDFVWSALLNEGVRDLARTLVVAVDDGQHAACYRLANVVDVYALEVVSSIHTEEGLAALLSCDALLVITDGQDYVCAQMARKARALGCRVFVHTVPWRQSSLPL